MLKKLVPWKYEHAETGLNKLDVCLTFNIEDSWET